MTYPEQNGHARGGGGGGGADGAKSPGCDSNSVTSFDDTATTITMTSPPDAISVITSGAVVPPKPSPDDAPPSCRKGYCRNMPFFVACLAVVFLVRGALLQYTEDVLTHIGRRYPITAPELRFVIGCERIGFVAALLFVAFFGNRMHKPWVISVGALVCAVGSILMAVPFFVSGPRLFDTRISQFAVAGLCKQTNRNVSFQTQCDLIAFKADDGTFTFTTISIAKLLIGIGGALYASLGLVYIEEGSKPHRISLYFGMVVCMHGYGRFVGNLLAAWFTSLPEAMNAAGSQRLLQEFAVYDQERVGRWWIGYPVFASLFTCLSLMTLWFPQYINVPDWVLRRRAKRARLEAELERRQRLKVLASKKRHASDANGHRKSKARHRGRKSGEVGEGKAGGEGSVVKGRGSGEVGDEGGVEALGVVNEVDVMADEDVLVSDKKGRTARGEDGARRKGGTNDDVAVDGDDVAIDVPNDSVVNLADLPSDIKRGGGDTSSLEVNMEEEDREKDFTEEKKRKRRKSRKATVAPEAETAAKMEGEGDGASTEDINRNRKSREEKGQSRSKRSSRAGVPDSSSTNRKYRQRTSGVGASTVTQHKPRRIRIKKESLSDLPQTVWRLLHNMRVLIVMFGAVLGGFYFNGYLATLPEYMHVQFQRSWGTSLILAGATGPLAWGMGTQLGGVLMFRFRSVPLVRVTLGVVVCIFTCCTLTLLSMVFHCQHDTSPNSTMTAYCGKWCECDSYMVQYEPLCGSDHKTYPSPCHAGCTAIERTSTVGLFKFTGCECVGGGYALQGACVPQCSHLAGFVVITFVAVLTASVGIVPAFTLLFRSVRSRSKSFAVGFAIWVVYTLSQTLGPVAFTYPRDGRCRHWGEDCLEENVCWSYDLQPYRLMVNGLAAAFLFASAVTFLLVYWHLKRSRARRLKQEAASQVMKLEQLENAVTTAENAPIDDVPMNTISEDVTTHSVPDVVTSVSPTIVSSINL